MCDSKEMFVCDGKVFAEVKTSLYEGGISVPLPVKKSAGIKWIGNKFPLELYNQIIAFFRWTYEDSKGEAQCRIAYNEKTGEWRVIVLPQEKSSGLSTKEIQDHPDKKAILAEMYKAGFEFSGTFHHHCSLGAFASATDVNDEQNQTGLHVTIGKINEPIVETHARVVYRAYKYDNANLPEWIAFPAGCMPEGLPQDLQNTVGNFFLTHPAKVDFPAEWKGRMIPKAVPVYTPGAIAGFHGNTASGVYTVGDDDAYYSYRGGNWWEDHDKKVTLDRQRVNERGPVGTHLYSDFKKIIDSGRTSFYAGAGFLTAEFRKAYSSLLDVMDRHEMSVDELIDAADLFKQLESELEEIAETEELKKEEIEEAAAEKALQEMEARYGTGPDAAEQAAV